jgi:hypothetical protein
MVRANSEVSGAVKASALRGRGADLFLTIDITGY